MTELQWWTCGDPREMVDFLRGRTTDRKLRLFLLAGCRQLWGSGAGGATQAALTVAEHLAEQGPVRTTNAVVRTPTAKVVLDCSASEPVESVRVWDGEGVATPINPAALDPLLRTALDALACVAPGRLRPEWVLDFLHRAGLTPDRQARLFREIVRGPFRPLLIPAAWFRWNDGLVRRLAGAIYAEQAFDRLPVLADALEEAGCADPELLGHLRGAGPHVLGCYALDALLQQP